MIPIAIKKRACELACVLVYEPSASVQDFDGTEVLFHSESGYNFLVFRGSDEGSDWRKNFCFWTKKLPGTGKFHTGFFNTVDHYQHRIYNLVPKGERKKPLIVCGHSKGGAEAQVFFALNPNKVAACLMFASPKPIKKLYNGALEHKLRQQSTIYVNPYDGVTRVPPFWKYIGKEVHRKLRLVGKSEHPGANYVDLFSEFTEDA